jgi:hypothetical protein
MDWECGASGRAPTLQEGNSSLIKKKKKKKKKPRNTRSHQKLKGARRTLL